MLQHADVWRAIDRLAAKYGLSPSGLAKRSGLDPTTFNRSKRIAKDGKQRWPSTESLAKILSATGASVEEFVVLLNGEDKSRTPAGLRRIGNNMLAEPGFFDPGGHPIGNGWAYMPSPEISDPSAYAIEVRGNSLMPTYSDGQILIASPESPVNAGHHAVLRLRDGSVLLGKLTRKSAEEIEFATFDHATTPAIIAADQVGSMSRILWVIN